MSYQRTSVKLSLDSRVHLGEESERTQRIEAVMGRSMTHGLSNTSYLDSYTLDPQAKRKWRLKNDKSTIMVNSMQRLQSFLKYWYFRYMLVTELYMVEKWERKFINIFFLVLFFLFFVFNYKVMLPFTQYMLQH